MTYRLAAFTVGPDPLDWQSVDDLISEANEPCNPDATYQDFSEVVDSLGGGKFGRGFPIARWHFDLFTANAWRVFREICPGPSAKVYIETDTNEIDGSGDPVWIQASAIMNWPVGEKNREANNLAQDADFEFTHIVEIEA